MQYKRPIGKWHLDGFSADIAQEIAKERSKKGYDCRPRSRKTAATIACFRR